MNPIVIRAAKRDELLAAPAVLLGFHPDETLVLMLLAEDNVACCLRMELDWYDHDFELVTGQLERALEQLPGSAAYVAVAYTRDDDAGLFAIDRIGEVLSEVTCMAEYLHRGDAFVCLCGECEPEPFDFASTAVAASAVYEGLRIESSRAVAIAPVLSSMPATNTEVGQAAAALHELSPEDSLVLLGERCESEVALTRAEALLVSFLLSHAEVQAEVFARALHLSEADPERADRLWKALVAARKVAPYRFLPEVLAMLALVSWLTGRGAAHSSCLAQLDLLPVSEPFGLLAHKVHAQAISPRAFRAERKRSRSAG